MSDSGKNSPTPKKRSKTFSGCFTCRSRKIRCDMRRPKCQNCVKAGLTCSGYDINLKWSIPIEFQTKKGNAISSLVKFHNHSKEVEGESVAVEFFHRRNVEFVVWNENLNCKPYDTYDEMDKDLGILHNSGNDQFVNIEGKTKLLGPFGVFKGRGKGEKRQKLNKYEGKGYTEELSGKLDQNLRALPSKTSELKNSPDPKTSSRFSPLFPSKSPRYSSNSSRLSPVDRQFTSSTSPNVQLPDSYPESAPHDQLWLSNELRDDALLTAAALNGDTQFLDFMNNFSPNGNNMVTPSQGSPSVYHNTKTPHNFNTNQNDFLNLVFHRNLSNQEGSSIANATASNNTDPSLNSNNIPSQLIESNLTGPLSNNIARTNMSMSNLLNSNDPSNILIDPTNQHLYYSNYNNYYYNNPYQLNENLEIHLHASRLPNSAEDESTDIVEGDHSNATRMPSSIMCIVQNPLQPSLGFDLSVPNLFFSSPKVGLPTTALQVQPLTRYLLNYYVTQVADLMTVIPLTENPWKTIYFPRALMAIGELSALGQTSIAKNALLNALLAVSAFNLQSKFPKSSASMKYYLNLGIRLRNQASLFIKQLLNSKTDKQSGVEYCVSHEKYKDVLCTVMSMISVDLVWGTMQDTNFYIKWCGKVITTKMMNKKKLSSKARILHRIFLSLKLIQDSTCLDFENVKVDFEENSEGRIYDVNGDKFGNAKEEGEEVQTRNNSEQSSRPSANPLTNEKSAPEHNIQNMGKGRIDFIVNSFTKTPQPPSTTSPSFVNKKLINTKDSDENFATDALYGLPNSLILIFSDTVLLLRTKIYHQEVYHTLPDNFTQRVNALNKKLLNWKLDWKLYEGDETEELANIEIDSDLKDDDLRNVEDETKSDLNKKFFSPMHEATYHHILSFYHALCIYFNRLIKEISPSKLQTKVAKTLNHLNAIQKLIARKEADIIPLFWQGFIAGCEAKSLNLQMGFKKWGADIAQYLGSYWGARQIMLEVWRRKRMNEARDDWVSVIQDWEMNLMLN
jgi:arginine metabolism regulation protein II